MALLTILKFSTREELLLFRNLEKLSIRTENLKCHHYCVNKFCLHINISTVEGFPHLHYC